VASNLKMAVPQLIKAIVPLHARQALRRMAVRARIRGKPFPFSVSPPQSETALDCVVAYNRYGAYCVPISGFRSFAALHVLAGDVWEAATLDFIAAHYDGGDIVHAGAFFGDFLPALALASGPDNKVWAFEPHPESYRCAQITIDLNQLTNVELANAGLGEQPGTAELVTHDRRGAGLGGTSTMFPVGSETLQAEGKRSTVVRIVTIDGAVPEHRRISMIHLDVEGYEERALAGALRTIHRCRPILLVETAPCNAWVSEYLRPLGYRVSETVLGNTVLRPD
jgi:FkbM family methyltransferase